MAQTSSQPHNPALKPLEGLVGDWKMELSEVLVPVLVEFFKG